MLSQTSLQRLNSCDIRIQQIILEASRVSAVDFGVAEGHRTIERQQQLFREGKTKIDGITSQSGHNYTPSRAVDIYGYVNGKADYSIATMCYLAGVIQTVATKLGTPLRWGGNWDGDGEILTDQNFDDLPHFEI